MKADYLRKKTSVAEIHGLDIEKMPTPHWYCYDRPNYEVNLSDSF